eukprot:1714915-Pyramimonas_sp.AAC.1
MGHRPVVTRVSWESTSALNSGGPALPGIMSPTVSQDPPKRRFQDEWVNRQGWLQQDGLEYFRDVPEGGGERVLFLGWPVPGDHCQGGVPKANETS